MKQETSDYAKYHSAYLGYDFKNKMTGKLYSKGDFWDSFTSTARLLPTRIAEDTKPITPGGFRLVERPKQDLA